MELVSSQTLTAQNFRNAVTLATLAAPTGGAAMYAVDVRVAGMPSGPWALIFLLTVDGVDYYATPGDGHSGAAGWHYAPLEVPMAAGDASVTVKAQDSIVQDSSATVTVRVFRQDSVNTTQLNGAAFTLLSTVEGLVVYNRSPVKPDHLDLYKADYYSTVDGTGRTLSFTWDGEEPWPDTIDEAHFYCTPTQATIDDNPAAVGLDAIALTVDTATGSSRKVTLTLTNTQTDTLDAGVGAYTFGIVANKSTRRAVLRSGTMTVRPDPAA